MQVLFDRQEQSYKEQLKEQRREIARAEAKAALEEKKRERESEDYSPKVTMEDLEQKIRRPPPVIVNPAPRPKPSVQKQDSQVAKKPRQPAVEKSAIEKQKNAKIPRPDIKSKELVEEK